MKRQPAQPLPPSKMPTGLNVLLKGAKHVTASNPDIDPRRYAIQHGPTRCHLDHELYRNPSRDNPLAAKLEGWSTNLQKNSVLFQRVPREIRQEIWLFALTSYQDTKSPEAPFHSYGYRPSTRYPTTQAVALLRTCRAVYAETHDLPASLRTFVSWRCTGAERLPKGQPFSPEFYRLAPAELHRVQHYHFYAAQCALEMGHRWLQNSFAIDSYRSHDPMASHIRTLRVTIRHTDFTGWEIDHPLTMDGNGAYGKDWKSGLHIMPNLEEVVFELETVERRAHEMDALVKDIKKWKFTLKDGRVLRSDGIPIKSHTWIGSSQFSGGQKPPAGTTSIPYHVVIITWKAPKPVINRGGL